MTDLPHLTDDERKLWAVCVIGSRAGGVTPDDPAAMYAVFQDALENLDHTRAELAAAQAKLDAIDGLAEKWLLQEQFPSKTGYGEGAYKCATDLQRITNKEKA